MDENLKKNAVVKMMTEVEYSPVNREDIESQNYTKIPMSEFTALGTAFSSILPAFRTITQDINFDSGEKLYRMVVKDGIASGESVVQAKSGGILGNIIGKNGRITKRARFFEVGTQRVSTNTVMPVNPAMMLMAFSIVAISKKLDTIEEAQRDIIEFLQLKEKAILKGNLAVLQEILTEYKYNWDNEKYKNNKHIQVQEIKRDSEQSIIFCREQIEKKIGKKAFLHSDRDVKNKIQKIQYEFKDYELALYLFAFSAFLEVMLLENFDAGYLETVAEKIGQYADEYRNLHTMCYDQIAGDSATSIQAYALKGVAGLNKVMGNTIARIPKIKEGQIDETLIAAGSRVEGYNSKRTENTMELFADAQVSCVRPFVENIQIVNRMYNHPMELLFDNENVYIENI